MKVPKPMACSMLRKVRATMVAIILLTKIVALMALVLMSLVTHRAVASARAHAQAEGRHIQNHCYKCQDDHILVGQVDAVGWVAAIRNKAADIPNKLIIRPGLRHTYQYSLQQRP